MTKPRVGDIDKHIGARMRERRLLLGFTQEQAASLFGVTYQQAYKYEKGINRVAAGRLYQIAQAFGVTPDYFFEGLNSGEPAPRSVMPQQRAVLELGRNFIAIKDPMQQAAVCALARALRSAEAE